MSLKKLITETISIEEKLKSLQSIKDVKHDLSDYKLLRKGEYARVLTKKNKSYVIRVEEYGTDVDNTIYEELAKVDKGTYNHLVHVYYFKELPDNTTITVMEKLELLENRERRFIHTLFSMFFIRGIFDINKIKEFSDGKGFDNLINDIFKGIEEYKSITGEIPIDLHGDNVMRDPKTKKAKLIDLSYE